MAPRPPNDRQRVVGRLKNNRNREDVFATIRSLEPLRDEWEFAQCITATRATFQCLTQCSSVMMFKLMARRQSNVSSTFRMKGGTVKVEVRRKSARRGKEVKNLFANDSDLFVWRS